jgi:hypothetical protein
MDFRALGHHEYNFINKIYTEAETQNLSCKVRYKQVNDCAMPTSYGILLSMSIICWVSIAASMASDDMVSLHSYCLEAEVHEPGVQRHCE